jgi:tRNA (guanosine-2'-O-)-methyltransferase
MGTERWLTLQRYRTAKNKPGNENVSPTKTLSSTMAALAPTAAHPATASALGALKARGYRLAALTLRGDPVDLCDVPLDRPLALLIGTELTGLSDTAHQFADLAVKLPMEGFAQSFNLSVCAAVCLYELTRRLRDPRGKIPWPLPEEEKRLLFYDWVHRDVPGADELLARWGA